MELLDTFGSQSLRKPRFTPLVYIQKIQRQDDSDLFEIQKHFTSLILTQNSRKSNEEQQASRQSAIRIKSSPKIFEQQYHKKSKSRNKTVIHIGGSKIDTTNFKKKIQQKYSRKSKV
ncbi:hypothetical protein pb186bvf_001613 [Paramecium bursaria]